MNAQTDPLPVHLIVPTLTSFDVKCGAGLQPIRLAVEEEKFVTCPMCLQDGPGANEKATPRPEEAKPV